MKSWFPYGFPTFCLVRSPFSPWFRLEASPKGPKSRHLAALLPGLPSGKRLRGGVLEGVGGKNGEVAMKNREKHVENTLKHNDFTLKSGDFDGLSF